MKKHEKIELGIKDKDESGKNTKSAFDRNFYHIRRFFELAIKNNPNTIELFFVNPENIVSIDETGKEILRNSELLS